MSTAERILEKHESMVGKRQPWESLWERAAEIVMPHANGFDGNSPGQENTEKQYDAFAMGALNRWDATIEAGAMPRSSKWHFLTSGDEDLDQDSEVKAFYEAYDNIIWRERYVPRGNFVSAAHKKRQSLGLYGTGTLLVLPHKMGGLRYRSIPLAEIYTCENADGELDTNHRVFEMSPRDAVMEFGPDAPEKARKAFEEGKGGKKFELIHAVCPREDFDPKRLDEKGKRFVGYYIDADSKKIIREEGYRTNPYITSRYLVAFRETYGRSPVTQSLPDIRMLNQMKFTMIDYANKTLDPATMSHDEVSEFDLVAGAHNAGKIDDNGRPMVIPFNPGGDPRVAEALMQDVRNQIDDSFLGVYFRVLLENPNMTATQAMLIAQQQGQMTAPALGRIQAEWLSPMIRRESSILFAQGRAPKMPDKLATYLRQNRKSLNIRYESPLTKAARAEEGIAILRAFESLAPMAQIDPSVYKVFNVEEAARIVTEVAGVPTKAIKSREQIEAESQQDQQAAELGQVLQAAPIAAQTAKTLAEAQQIALSNPQPVVGP